MKIARELRRCWERRFPGLSGKWTHWKITGTGELLAVVSGADLLAALKVVEENYDRYATIETVRATLDENGALEEDFEIIQISNLGIDDELISWCRRWGDA
jgi:hypothetical protein